MVKVEFHRSPMLDAQAPVKKDEPKGLVYVIPRKQRRKQEQELRRRSKKHRPLIDKDYRWQKLSEEQLKQCYDAFVVQAEYSKYGQSGQFVMTWPMTPKIEEYCKEHNIAYVQQQRYKWVIVVPAATAQEAFEFKLNKAVEAKAEVILVTTQDENTDYITSNEQVDFVIKDANATGVYAVVLKQEGIIHANYHDEMTFDELLLIDAFNAKRQQLTIHANEATKVLIDTISSKFDTIESIQVLETIAVDKPVYRLTITYKPEVKTEQETVQ